MSVYRHHLPRISRAPRTKTAGEGKVTLAFSLAIIWTFPHKSELTDRLVREHIPEITTLHLLLLTSSCSQITGENSPEDSSLRSCLFCAHSMPSPSLDPLNEAHNITAGSRMHTQRVPWDWNWIGAPGFQLSSLVPRMCFFQWLHFSFWGWRAGVW